MSKELNEELYLSPETETTELVETDVKGENKKFFRMTDGVG